MNVVRSKFEKTIYWSLVACASTTIICVALIFIFIGKEGIQSFLELPLSNILGTSWVPTSLSEEGPQYGILPLILGSVLVTLLATFLAVPMGVCGAVYLASIAKAREREILKPLIEVLAGIPSVVLGFFGLMVIGPVIKDLFGLTSGMTALTGAILLAFMAVPTILSIAEDAIQAVPRAYTDASLALGATEWQTTWKVVLPAARSGVIAAAMLGIGRVIGETMAVLMVTGNAAQMTVNPFESVRTMTATVAAEMGEVAHNSVHYRALFLVALVLLIMTLLINLSARRLLVKRIRKRRKR